MLEFNILKGQYLNRLDKNVVSADTTDLKAQFDLTSDFTGTITVWWRRSDVDNTYTSTLAADGTCTIPAEALAATDKAVYGPYDHDVFVSISDTGRTTTNEYKLTVQRSAFSTDATPGTGGSPTAYEKLVEQFDELKEENQTFKDNMTEQQETFESTVTENVDNIRYIVETETAPPIIEEASGAEITLDDSAYRQVRGLQLYGYSKQTQTTGAQLIPDKVTTGTASGVKMTLNSDGSFTLNGTNTGGDSLGIYFVGGYGSTTEFLPTGNYFYKVDGLNEGDACIVRGTGFESIDSNPASISQHNITQLGIALSSGTTYNNVKIYPMLNAGTSALPWEPYSGGVASPSPDWAQPIHSVADDTNLLDESLFTQTGSAFRFIHIQTDAESVTVSSNIPRTSAGSAYIQAIPGNVSSVEGISTSTNGVYAGQNRTISPSDGYITIGYYLNGTGGESINFSDYWVMVNAGDVALSYRPYGHNVTAESEGAQLIRYPYLSSNGVTKNGITYTVSDDGVITANGTATDQSLFCMAAESSGWRPSGEVFLSGCPSGGSLATYRIHVYNYNTEDAFAIDNGKGTAIDFTNTDDPWNLCIRIASGYTANNLTFKPMLNRGSSPLPWQPYVAPSSALITLTDSLRGIPVSSGGNYTDESGQQWIADYIYRRQTDGKWCLWRNCGRLECDGSEDENWSVSGNRMIVNLGVLFPDARRFVLCNRGVFSASGSEIGASFIYNRYFYYTPYPQYLAVNEFKTWLQTNPLDVVYQLLSPTVEELPDDVQAELNGLYTYNLHTDMWNNDGAYMNLKYVADTKTWINNKIAGISTAMLNQN